MKAKLINYACFISLIYPGILVCMILCAAWPGNKSITISLGRQGEDCRSRGVCGFSNSANQSSANTDYVEITDSLLKIGFNRSRLSPPEIRKLFGTDSVDMNEHYIFPVEKEYSISPDDGILLGTTNRFTSIPIQSTPITLTGNIAEITLQLK